MTWRQIAKDSELVWPSGLYRSLPVPAVLVRAHLYIADPCFNPVEQVEKRKDSQLSREISIALPVETKAGKGGKALVSWDQSLLGFLGSPVCPFLFTMANNASDSVLSTLLSADAELATQEAQLNAQLEAIQVKRSSLKTVLGIFDSDHPTTAEINVEIADNQTADGAIESAKEAPAKTVSKEREKPTTDKPALPRKAASKSQALRRGWQKYMRDNYLQTPLPDIVAGILKAQPKKVFEIAEVVNTIVIEDIPHAERKNARNQISNILAEGARKDQWLRPQAGGYRFAK